uniref:Uncharacterized protein n=1 Tax=Moniliophthora roreri TaxID=221103 RepID=A0A0W0FTB5_MONRR
MLSKEKHFNMTQDNG